AAVGQGARDLEELPAVRRADHGDDAAVEDVAQLSFSAHEARSAGRGWGDHRSYCGVEAVARKGPWRPACSGKEREAKPESLSYARARITAVPRPLTAG